jgi:hypothetical protein
MHAQREMNLGIRGSAYCLLLAALAVLGWTPCLVNAQQTPPASAPTAAAATAAAPEEIAKLVKQLDDNTYATRQAASDRLAAIGGAAISALEKAAVGTSAEVTSRSVELLGKFLDSADLAVRVRARAALETVAKSDNTTAADRAKQALEAKNPNRPANVGFANGIAVGAIRIAAINVAVAAGGAGGAQKVSVRNTDGVRDIDVEDGGRKIKIHDDPAKAITVEVTETKDGKETTTKTEAKDADDLKKKSAEAFKVYKQYAQDNQGAANIQLQVAGGGVNNGPVAVGGAGFAGVQPAANTPDTRTRLATIRLQAMARQLTALVKSEDVKDLPAESKDALKKQLDEIKAQLADLEKQLAPAATTKPAESK